MKRSKENKVIGAIFLLGALVVAAILITPDETVIDTLSTERPPKPDIPVPQRLPDISTLFARKVPDASLPIEKLPPPDMNRIKREGCVADGLLSGYGRTSKDVKVVNNSNCYYLHRAIETWREAPDFDKARKIRAQITRKDVVYGMFIAEAISTKEDYTYREKDRDFDFKDMCKKGTKNYWGEHTCRPSFGEEEYQAYLRQITHDAMDMGVQTFLFGQIFLQDSVKPDKTKTPDVIADMRVYANEIGIEIVIGAQTNDITDEQYLRNFDFIEGGVGLASNGNVENGPCFSRWYKKPGDWCWALLWHPQFKNKANNVLVHFDWSGKIGDDMSTFTRMNEPTRHDTLRNLHKKFTSQDVGFLLPLLTPLPKDGGGCHGPKKRFYSPSNKYGCHDENTINDILHKIR